jgi:hypothetical protein
LKKRTQLKEEWAEIEARNRTGALIRYIFVTIIIYFLYLIW